MPKLYEYLGLIVFFYSNEHDPIHVHARHGEFESSIEIRILQGQVQSMVVRRVAGKAPLPARHLRNFKTLVQKLADEIVQSWVNYFIYHKKIVAKKIQGKL